MTNFWDLPKKVREKIYRLHLVYEHDVRVGYPEREHGSFLAACNRRRAPHDEKMMPALLQADPKMEKEAAHIYFGENRFEFHTGQLDCWFKTLSRKHRDQIRKVSLSFEYEVRSIKALSYEKALRKLAAMRSLCDVSLAVCEQSMIQHLLKNNKSTAQWHDSLGYGPQIQLQMLRINGMSELREMRGLQTVYVPIGDNCDPEDLSPDPDHHCYSETAMPGGLFSIIRREIMQPRDPKSSRPKGHFRFLELPPELRNVIYGMHLTYRGVTYPSNDVPSSVASWSLSKKKGYGVAARGPLSALELLRVSRQIHDEAYKVFYHDNDLVFSTTARLQAFMMSLSEGRLNAIRSVTLFCCHDKVSKHQGASTVDATLFSLRQLRGLEKLCILVPGDKQKRDDASNLATLRPTDVPGLSTLFSFRHLEDIKCQQLAAENWLSLRCQHRGRMSEAKRQVAAFRHLSHGLLLAQKGMVNHELYTDRDWYTADTWPVLEGSDCGWGKGCSCGSFDDRAQELLDDAA